MSGKTGDSMTEIESAATALIAALDALVGAEALSQSAWQAGVDVERREVRSFLGESPPTPTERAIVLARHRAAVAAAGEAEREMVLCRDRLARALAGGGA